MTAPSARFLVAAVGVALFSAAGAMVAGDRAAPDRPFGIERRTPWTTSRVVGSPDPPPPYQAVRAFPRLKLEQPLYLLPEPGSHRLFLVERLGKVRTFRDDPAADRADLLLELKDRETYSIAFHPDYGHNGFLYLFSNHSRRRPQRNVISRFQVRHTPAARCDAGSEREIISWESNGHDGGCLAFGPDGFLYVSTGDGTSGSDPNETGQNLSDLLGGMLRIDVEHPDPGKPYGVPRDNPFVGLAGARPEIWAYGLRNPWRFSFDPATGNLWLGDVGQDLWEMIYLIRRGGNYGWSVMEGSHPFQLHRKRGPTPILPPVVEHPHAEFRSIIGGFVYHGDRLPELRGAYIYGDHETGVIWGLRHDGRRVTGDRELARTPLKIVAFGRDRAGELYVVSLGGEIHRLEPATETRANPHFPKRLSDTGLFTSVAQHRPAPGLIPYSVNSPLWSDGAAKERFLALPGLSQVGLPEGVEEAWDLPEGTVLVKTFSLDLEGGARRRVETRLLTRQRGQWRGYSYRWDEAQSDAELVPAGGADGTYRVRDDRAPGGRRVQTWHFPSRAECMVCHTRAAGFVLGLNTPQMNRVHDYGGVRDNQLRTLAHLGVFRTALPRPPAELPRLPDPEDPNVPVALRARSYLHANCAHCHVTDGGGNARMELRFSTPMARTGILGIVPQHESFGIADARLVAPGDPDRSVVYQRIIRLGPGRMPPLASSVVDEKGAQLLREWIARLKDRGKD